MEASHTFENVLQNEVSHHQKRKSAISSVFIMVIAIPCEQCFCYLCRKGKRLKKGNHFCLAVACSKMKCCLKLVVDGAQRLDSASLQEFFQQIELPVVCGDHYCCAQRNLLPVCGQQRALPHPKASLWQLFVKYRVLHLLLQPKAVYTLASMWFQRA